MRITDKKPHDQYRIKPMPFFTKHEALFGHILSNDFDNPHIHVYEHVRFNYDEMSDHPPLNSTPDNIIASDDILVSEEEEVMSVIRLQEFGQMLTIIGDVGTGKTTFLRHLCDVHFGSEPFGKIDPVYLDWNDFTASLNDPLPDIYNKFSENIYEALEKLLTNDEWMEIDKSIFQKSKIFSLERNQLPYIPENEQSKEINRAIKRKMENDPISFAIERINAICNESPNRIIIIIDNIDHLRPPILEALQDFLGEIRIKTAPLLILALRDHTLEKGFSGYDRMKVKPYWKFRLYSPDLQKVVLRRLDYFFPKDIKKGAGRNQETPTGISLSMSDEQLKKSCRALLESPFLESNTHIFIRRWSNYNLRDAFQCIQKVVSFPGLSSREGDLIGRAENINITVDDCITSLALGNSKLFYPHRSVVFNVYSASLDGGMIDMLSGVRLIQYLSTHKELVSITTLQEMFSHFGYPKPVISRQIHWMACKDVIWTDAGDPADLTDGSMVRLSYRGKIYVTDLLPRVTYNYLMSFNVFSPSKEHLIGRMWASEFDEEVDCFSQLGETLSGDAIGQRVLGLAELLYDAEIEEIRQLREKKLLEEYKSDIGVTSATEKVLSGLSKFLNIIISQPDRLSRKIETPNQSLLRDISELKDKNNRNVEIILN